MSEDITVNIGGTCPSGTFATFKDEKGGLITLSLVCDGEYGHPGVHYVTAGPTWVDDAD